MSITASSRLPHRAVPAARPFKRALQTVRATPPTHLPQRCLAHINSSRRNVSFQSTVYSTKQRDGRSITRASTGSGEETESSNPSAGQESLWEVLIDSIIQQGIDGAGGMAKSAKELAEEYNSNPRYTSPEDRVKALIRIEATKNFATGFVSGVGGLWTLPFAVPASVYANWLIQARVAGAVAHLRGHDLSTSNVRSLVLLCLLGDGAWSVLRSTAVKFMEESTSRAISRIPVRALVQLNEAVGMKLIVKCGENGAIKLQRAIPIVGGVVAGAFDASACVLVGKVADRIFNIAGDPFTAIDWDGVIDVQGVAVDEDADPPESISDNGQ